MDQDSPTQRGPRFGIGLLFLLMTLVAFAAAGPGALQRTDANWRPFFVIFTLVAPGLLLIVVSLWQKYLRPR